MALAEYLIPLPSSLGNAITEAVQTFAKGEHLEAELWVHDLPLWFMFVVDKPSGVVRRLQIGAYRLGESDEVRVVPQVFTLDRDGRSLIAAEQIDPSWLAPIHR